MKNLISLAMLGLVFVHSSDGINKSVQWSVAEDQKLKDAVETLGGRKWKAISELIPGRSIPQCYNHWNRVLNPAIKKCKWSKEEDDKLTHAVNMFGTKKWTKIATLVPGRTGKQCRERWVNYLAPNISKRKWTPAEDMQIIALVRQYGTKWTKISELMLCRSYNSIKNRYYGFLSKKCPELLSGNSPIDAQDICAPGNVTHIEKAQETAQATEVVEDRSIPVDRVELDGIFGLDNPLMNGFSFDNFDLFNFDNQ